MKQFTVADLINMSKREIVLQLEGNNETRTEKQVLEINGILLNGVSKIKVIVDNFITFYFLDENDKEVARHMMNKQEKFVIEDGLLGSSTYHFKKEVA